VPAQGLLDQAGLADPGRAGHQHDPALAVICRRHAGEQQLDFEPPADKWP